jgi:hypothetical protein
MAHMSYPENGTFESQGPCPASHPVRVSQLFYETIWDTTQFNNKDDWPTDGSQPFVWSFGDRYVILLRNENFAEDSLVLKDRLWDSCGLRLRLARRCASAGSRFGVLCKLPGAQNADDRRSE